MILKKYAPFVFALAMITPNFVSAEETIYKFEIDEHSYDLEYEINADVIAMAIDRALTSFLIGIENTQDSIFSIKLPSEMISAENNEFAVLVDGFEVDYSIVSEEDSVQMSFFVPAGTQEIEIIGTKVIPEFPLGILFVFATIIGLYIIITKNKKFKLLPYRGGQTL